MRRMYHLSPFLLNLLLVLDFLGTSVLRKA